jgi:hypothetical protein
MDGRSLCYSEDARSLGQGMRSTPARVLHQDQLLIERHAVPKITKVGHAIPHNTVIIEVTNQITGEEAAFRRARYA